MVDKSSAVAVSWAAPSGTQGVSFVAEALPVDTKLATRRCTSRALSCTIGDLTNGAEYLVEVRSMNAEGALSVPQRVRAMPRPDILTSKSSVLWLDADDKATVSSSSVAPGTLVSKWRDKSGRKNVATQPVETTRPSVSTLGKRRALKFSGLQNMILDGGRLPAGATPSLAFVVARLDDPNAANSCFGHILAWGSSAPGNARIIHKGCSTPLAFAETYGTYADMKPLKAWPVGRTVMLSAGFIKSQIDVRINGEPDYSWKAPKKIQLNTKLQPTAMIGGAPWAAPMAGWVGMIGEVIIFSGQIGTVDQKNVEQYLIRKWSIS